MPSPFTKHLSGSQLVQTNASNKHRASRMHTPCKVKAHKLGGSSLVLMRKVTITVDVLHVRKVEERSRHGLLSELIEELHLVSAEAPSAVCEAEADLLRALGPACCCCFQQCKRN